MKLAKKMLVCLMALVIAAMIGVYAMAANAVGDEVTVQLVFSNLEGAKSGNYEISYDASKLEFVKVKKNSLIEDDEPRISMAEAGNPEAGLVTYAFAISESLSGDGLDSATLLTITFKAIADGEAAISVKEVAKDGGSFSAALDTTSVTIGDVDETTTEEKPTQEKPTEEKPTQEKPTQEKPTQEKPTEEKPTQEKPTEEKTTIPQPGDETTTEVIPPVDDDEIIVGPNDFVKGDAADKDAACEKAASATKAAKAGKVAKVAQTGDTAVAVIAGIMAIGAVGFIATKKKEEI